MEIQAVNSSISGVVPVFDRRGDQPGNMLSEKVANMKRTLLMILTVAMVSLASHSANAQLFNQYSGGGYGGGGPSYYDNAQYGSDPRLGYCLKNDCCGGNAGNYGNHFGGNYGNQPFPNQQPGVPAVQLPPRSRFVVERGGRRVLTYVGTREGFVRRYPQYANRIVLRETTPGEPMDAMKRDPSRETVTPSVEVETNSMPGEMESTTPALPKTMDNPDFPTPPEMTPEDEGEASPSDEIDG